MANATNTIRVLVSKDREWMGLSRGSGNNCHSALTWRQGLRSVMASNRSCVPSGSQLLLHPPSLFRPHLDLNLLSNEALPPARSVIFHSWCAISSSPNLGHSCLGFDHVASLRERQYAALLPGGSGPVMPAASICSRTLAASQPCLPRF